MGEDRWNQPDRMRIEPGKDGVAIYHLVRVDEDFDHAAFNLLQLIRKVQQTHPGKRRILYLDIESHRNATGQFDQDMFELQSKFMSEFLLQFLSRVVMPLATIDNPRPQNDAIPDELNVLSIDNKSGDESSGGQKPRF